MQKLAHRLRHPWISMFVITASFQIFRGSVGDAIIFWAFTALAIMSQLNVPERIFINNPRLSRNRILLWVTLCTAALVAIPRHTAFYGLVMLAIGIAALAYNWDPDTTTKPRSDARIRRARFGWAIIGVGLCIWELAANILGQLQGNLTDFPTISVLIDPLLDNPLGQTVFVLGWILSGMGFLRLWSHKR